MARPKKKEADKCSQSVLVRMTRAERAKMDAEAKRRHLSLSGLFMSLWKEREK
jgi:hypothetical protein